MRLKHFLPCDSLMALIFSLITPKNFPVMEFKIPCSCFYPDRESNPATQIADCSIG
jgi:hypothetical protein